MDPIVTAALVSGGASAGQTGLGMLHQSHMAKKGHERTQELMGIQHQNQQHLNQQGHDLQYEMWKKTNYPAQMEMLKKAGLNPALLYGQGGAGGSTTGSQGGGSAASGSYSHAPFMDMGSMSDMMRAIADAKLKEKQGENLDSETEMNRGVKTDLMKTEIEKAKKETDNVESRTALIELEQVEQRIINANKQDEIRTAIEQGTALIKKLKADASISENTLDLIVEKMTYENLEAAYRIDKVKYEGEKLQEETRFISEQISMMYHRYNLDYAKATADVNIRNRANQLKNAELNLKDQMQDLTLHIEKLKLDQRTKELIVNNIGGILRSLIGGSSAISAAEIRSE
jgi:hypothetical protein